jgi:hypothetical protein
MPDKAHFREKKIVCCRIVALVTSKRRNKKNVGLKLNLNMLYISNLKIYRSYTRLNVLRKHLNM